MARGYNRIPEGIDILLNIAIVISTIVVLCLTWNEQPPYIVWFWIWSVTLLSVSQLIVAIILCNDPDHERAMRFKVCSFALSFILMMYGTQLLDDVLKQNAPCHYGFVILLVAIRMCYFFFYCCLVPSLYSCQWGGGSRNANELPLLRDTSVMPIMRHEYFTCFKHSGLSDARPHNQNISGIDEILRAENNVASSSSSSSSLP